MRSLRLILGLTLLAFPILLGAVAIFTDNNFLYFLLVLSLYLLSLWGDAHFSQIEEFGDEQERRVW